MRKEAHVLHPANKTNMTSLETAKEKLGKPYQDLEFLLDAMKSMLIRNDAQNLADQIPWINPINLGKGQYLPANVVQIYSMAFQLLNMNGKGSNYE